MQMLMNNLMYLCMCNISECMWVTLFTAPGCSCKSAPHLHERPSSHPGYYYLHKTRQRSAHLFRCAREKQKGRQVDKERSGVRVLVYSFGPAIVIKQHFAAFLAYVSRQRVSSMTSMVSNTNK